MARIFLQADVLPDRKVNQNTEGYEGQAGEGEGFNIAGGVHGNTGKYAGHHQNQEKENRQRSASVARGEIAIKEGNGGGGDKTQDEPPGAEEQTGGKVTPAVGGGKSPGAEGVEEGLHLDSSLGGSAGRGKDGKVGKHRGQRIRADKVKKADSDAGKD